MTRAADAVEWYEVPARLWIHIDGGIHMRVEAPRIILRVIEGKAQASAIATAI